MSSPNIFNSSFAHYQDYDRYEGIILVLCVTFGILFLFQESV